MKIKNKDIKLLYCIGADCELDDEMQKIGAVDFQQMLDVLGLAKTYAKVGAIMSKWYCIANGGEPVTEQEFLLLPADALTDLVKLVIKAMDEGRKQEIKTKSKNAKSAARSK